MRQIVRRLAPVLMIALVTCALVEPVAADDAIKSDPYADGNVRQEGTHAPKNADADETSARFGVIPVAGSFGGSCVAAVDANGVWSYQQTVFRITPAGFTPSTRVFADASCTIPLAPWSREGAPVRESGPIACK